MQFQVTLKNSKTRSYHLITALIVVIHLAAFVFLLFSNNFFFNAFVSLFLLVLYLLIRFYMAWKYKTIFYADPLTYFILAGSWLAIRNYELMVICIALGVLYYFSLQKIQFLFTEKGIRKINFPSAEYAWDELDNVILRDNILTIDFTNNKLIQCEIDDDSEINERQFNQFIKDQLTKNPHPEEKMYLN